MNSYKVLNKQVYTNGEYSIVPIRYADRMNIMQWRNEQIYHLRQNSPLTPESQDRYFKDTVLNLFEQELPNQILFSYLRNGHCIGYGGLVHINWIDAHAEISFIMDTSLEKDEFDLHWQTYINLIEQVAFEGLNLHKIFVYAFDLRPGLYPILESVGYFKDAVLTDHCFYNGNFLDVVIYSKIKAR